MKGHGVFFKLSLQFRVTKHRCIREQSLVLRLQLLRRYDTIKTCRWNFFKFSWVVHHAIFWVLEVKRSKILQKLNKWDCFCLHSWFHFLWRFPCKIWFVFGSRKDDLNVPLFLYKNWCSQKSDWQFFSNFDCQRTFP